MNNVIDAANMNDVFANHLPATNLAVTSSDRPRFKRFRAALLAEHDPQTVTERIVAEQIVTHRWFLAQYDAALSAVMRAAVYVQHNPPLTVSDAFVPAAAKLKSKLAEANVPPSRADLRDAEHARAVAAAQLDKIYKYRKEHERALDRAVAEWKTFLAARPVPDPPDSNRRGITVPFGTASVSERIVCSSRDGNVAGTDHDRRDGPQRSAKRTAGTRNDKKPSEPPGPESPSAATPTPSLSMKVLFAGSLISDEESRPNEIATQPSRSGGAAGLRREDADRHVVAVTANEAEHQHRSLLKLFAGQQRDRAGPSPARSDALRSAQSGPPAQISRHRRGGELRSRLPTATGLPDRAGRNQRADQTHLRYRSARGRVGSLPHGLPCRLRHRSGSGL